jgi:hypothetical protein
VDEALVRHILALEESLLRAEVRQSAQRVAERISDDFTEFTSSGTMYRYHPGDIFDSPADGEIRDFSLRPLGGGCVLATYRFIRSGGIVTLRSSIWQLMNGRWKMIFHQGTQALR